MASISKTVRPKRSNNNTVSPSGYGLTVGRGTPSVGGGAFDYYISPTGSDSNTGTLGSPWAITALSSKSQIAGKRVGLLSGTYVLQNTDYTSAAQLVGYGGSAVAHTIIESVTPRAAIITGYNGSTYSDSTLLGTRQDYVTFKNLTIRQGASKLLTIDADHVTVTGCDIGDLDQRRHSAPSYGDNTECIRVEQYTGANAPTDILIENCYLHDVLNTAGGATGNNSSAVKIYDCEGLTIRNCTMVSTGEPVYCKYNPAGVTVEGNFIATFSVTAIYGIGGDENWSNGAAASTFSNYVRWNIILGQQGIDAGATAGAYHIGQQVYVYNNTLYRNGDIGSAITFRDAPGAYIRHYNNIAYGTSSTGYGTVRVEQAADFALSDYNCFSPFTGTSNGASRASLAVWRTATGWDAGSIASNPVFANAGGTTPADYALAGGSPCLNAGRSNGTSGGSVVDMGAWGNGAPANIGCDFA